MLICEMIFQRLLIVKSPIISLPVNFRSAAFLIALLLGAATPTMAGQEVARIPFINAPDGTAGLGAGSTKPSGDRTTPNANSTLRALNIAPLGGPVVPEV